MGFLKKLFGQENTNQESNNKKYSKPKFLHKKKIGINMYEVYQGSDAESAKAFLQTKKVTKSLYYLIVETQDGNWGKDIEGLFLENLLVWQTNIESAQYGGRIIPHTWTKFGVESVAKGDVDNFIVKVKCGKCKNEWLDGIRYQNITVVRCPECKGLIEVNSKGIKIKFFPDGASMITENW